MESDSERKKSLHTVVVCNEDKVNLVTFKWKWGEDDLPILDQYTYHGIRDLKGLLLGCTHSESHWKGYITSGASEQTRTLILGLKYLF